MAIVKISDLPLVDSPVEGTDLFVVVQDNVTKKAFASDIQTYVGFEEIQYATAGQTVFTLTTMTYAAGANNLMVFVDGVNQYEGLSYVETNNNTVTFTQGLHVGAVVKFSTVQTQTSSVASAGAVSFLQAGTGAIPRSVQDKERDIVSVKDFGAVGDGVTNDMAAINTAISAVGPTGKSLYFPAGKYLISSTINVDWAITLFGEIATIYSQSSYPYGTVIVKGASVSGPAISLNSDKCAVKSMGVVGLQGNIGDGIHLNANGCLLENVQVKYVGSDGVRIGGYSTFINANSCILNNVISNYNGAAGLYIHDGFSALPNANACSITALSCNFNAGNGVTLGNCFQNTFLGAHLEDNGGWGIQADPESKNNAFFGGDNTEVHGLGQLWNRGVSNMFFLDSLPTYTEAGLYTVALTSQQSILSGSIRQTHVPVSNQGGANYFSTQVFVDGFFGGATGTTPVTNGATYRLFTCNMPTNGNFLHGTLYLSYHPALGSTGAQRTFKAYAISATTNSTGLAASAATELTEFSDVDSVLTTNVAAIGWSAGVLTLSNTNTRPDAAGQLLSWSFIGYQRGCSNFASLTAV